MEFKDAGANGTYTVVLNGEEQYSIWPTGRDIPSGWRPALKTGTRDECLAFIKEVWTDMRPLSVRESETVRNSGQ
jgi:MbtH protein